MLQCAGVDQVTVKATRAISDENPGANVEGGAFSRIHVVVERGPSNSSDDRRRSPYLARQLSVFYHQALRGIPRGD